MINSGAHKKQIKCVVWDLDNTLWRGTLLEDNQIYLNPQAEKIIKTLDQRGILNSIASKNEFSSAMRKLQEFGLAEYFLYPQINWNSKAASLEKIAQALNISLSSIAFVDDLPFERAEVQHAFPAILCLDAAEIGQILAKPELTPRWITAESKLRRKMYQADINRQQVAADFIGPQDDFLTSLEMVFEIFPANGADLQRAEELTVRTNQLNSTGKTYSYAELNQYRQSDQHLLWMARLADKFGVYGTIGLVLVTCNEPIWKINLLLMSCRVIARGVGSILLGHVMWLARANDARLQADFIPNDRNRMMEITYRFAGFETVSEDSGLMVLEHNLQEIPTFPDYLEVQLIE
jgi:FkbH-like protein